MTDREPEAAPAPKEVRWAVRGTVASRRSGFVASAVVAGLLTIGLGLPFVFGEPENQPLRQPTAGGPGAVAGPAVTVTETTVGGGPTDPSGLVGGTATGGRTRTGTAGGGAGATEGTGGGGEGSSAPGAGNTASDVGVTPGTIKVGFVWAQSQALGQLGLNFQTGDVRGQFQTFVDEVNARGGIHGRKIEGVFRSWDASRGDAEGKDAACVGFTEDDKVFAVVNTIGFVREGALCVTERHGTPLMTGFSGHPDEYYSRSKGLLFSVRMTDNRLLHNQVAELHAAGLLKGKRIGIVSDPQQSNGTEMVEQALIPALAEHGYSVTHWSKLGDDLSSAQSQVPVEVGQMRSKRVDVVIMAVNVLLATTWVQQSEAQQFLPAYYTSDFDSGANNSFGQSMPRSFDGALGLTVQRTGEVQAGRPQAPSDADCQAVYEKASGKRLTPGNDEHHSTMQACTLVRVFAAGVDRAGPTLTRASWAQGMEQVGRFDVAFAAGGRFGADRHDATDHVRFVRWQFTCRCWVPHDEFRPGRR